jgi:hypothetical protein
MFNSTFNHLKSLVKGSFNLVKDSTIGTLSAIKTDIVNYRTDLKEVRELRESRNNSQNSEKSE